jgi:carboxymethylenebutenolidase
LFTLAAVALLTAPVAAGPIQEATGSFTAGGKPIRVEQFGTKAAGRRPAVIVLHGSEGVKDFGAVYRHYARMLAQEGYVVLLIHYFDRTGTARIGPKDIKPEQFRAWADTARGAVRYAAGRPEVDGKRIGLLGFSLGAYLALAVAARGDLPIAAVIDLFGGLPKDLHEGVKTLPPTLIVHGDADRTVPVREAYALADLLKDRKVPCEIKVYKGQDHLFKTDPLGSDVLDATKRCLAFFGKHLKARRPGGRPSSPVGGPGAGRLPSEAPGAPVNRIHSRVRNKGQERLACHASAVGLVPRRGGGWVNFGDGGQGKPRAPATGARWRGRAFRGARPPGPARYCGYVATLLGKSAPNPARG